MKLSEPHMKTPLFALFGYFFFRFIEPSPTKSQKSTTWSTYFLDPYIFDLSLREKVTSWIVNSLNLGSRKCVQFPCPEFLGAQIGSAPWKKGENYTKHAFVCEVFLPFFSKETKSKWCFLVFGWIPDFQELTLKDFRLNKYPTSVWPPQVMEFVKLFDPPGHARVTMTKSPQDYLKAGVDVGWTFRQFVSLRNIRKRGKRCALMYVYILTGSAVYWICR